MTNTNNIKTLVAALGLEEHVEGGYFKQTFKADKNRNITTAFGERSTLTSIYYLLTRDSPIGHFHLNRSDIMHYFHTGDPITYYLIYPDGKLVTKILGPDFDKGHEFQFVVEGGVWKASELGNKDVNGYGLIGEAVSPGFEFQDMKLGVCNELRDLYPQHSHLFDHLIKIGADRPKP